MQTNKIYCGDCIEMLKSNRVRARLIFADPPFNIGYKYNKYKDRLNYDEYVDWTEEWMDACCSSLTDDGSFYVAIGDEYAAEVKMTARKLNLHTRNWIIWHYGFGQNTVRKFGRSHTHILYFVKNCDNFIFNDADIRIPSERQLRYADKRADSRGRIPGDVWKYSRICGTFSERVSWHTCQMPLRLMARIIKASSNQGDLVLDPFSGSASTLAAAAVLGREYLGFDIDEKYAAKGQKRIEEIVASEVTYIDDKDTCMQPPSRSTRRNDNNQQLLF